MSGLPSAIAPMLASVAEPFDSDEHYFEVKWDGARCIAFIDPSFPGGLRLQSRPLRDMTGSFPELAVLPEALSQPSGVVLDGELVSFVDGRPSFSRMLSRLRVRTPGSVAALARDAPVAFVAFDLLYQNGTSLMSAPWETRRQRLLDLVQPSPCLQVSTATKGTGLALFEAVRTMGLEGTVAKDARGVYSPGLRTRAWLKSRVTREESMAICGYTTRRESARRLSALVLGTPSVGEYGWEFRGSVGTGFSEEDLAELVVELSGLRTAAAPDARWTTDSRVAALSRGGQTVDWVRPELACNVEYLELTEGGLVRHAVFRGLSDPGGGDVR